MKTIHDVMINFDLTADFAERSDIVEDLLGQSSFAEAGFGVRTIGYTFDTAKRSETFADFAKATDFGFPVEVVMSSWENDFEEE